MNLRLKLNWWNLTDFKMNTFLTLLYFCLRKSRCIKNPRNRFNFALYPESELGIEICISASYQSRPEPDIWKECSDSQFWFRLEPRTEAITVILNAAVFSRPRANALKLLESSSILHCYNIECLSMVVSLTFECLRAPPWEVPRLLRSDWKTL